MANVLSLDTNGDFIEIVVGGDTIVNATNSTGGALAAGTWVQLYNVSGVFTMRKADWSNTNDYMAWGVIIDTSVANTTVGRVQLSGLCSVFTSLTPGTDYFGDPATPGAHVTYGTYTTGQKIQKLMRSISTTQAYIMPWPYRIKKV